MLGLRVNQPATLPVNRIATPQAKVTRINVVMFSFVNMSFMGGFLTREPGLLLIECFVVASSARPVGYTRLAFAVQNAEAFNVGNIRTHRNARHCHFVPPTFVKKELR